MHISNAINIYEQVHNQWNDRIDEVISEYGNESLAEQEPMWNILNAVQHNVRKKPHKISPPKVLHQPKMCIPIGTYFNKTTASVKD